MPLRVLRDALLRRGRGVPDAGHSLERHPGKAQVDSWAGRRAGARALPPRREPVGLFLLGGAALLHPHQALPAGQCEVKRYGHFLRNPVGRYRRACPAVRPRRRR